MIFDAQMRAESDNCAPGYFCYAAGSRSEGTCTRACRNGEPTCMQSSQMLSCSNPYDPTSNSGMCLIPARPITDIGSDCSRVNQCQGRCSIELGLTCTVGCPGITACPLGSSCLNTPFGNDCVKECPHGDIDCELRGSPLLCQTRMSWTGEPLCLPKCTSADAGYCPPGTTCDVTGHCT